VVVVVHSFDKLQGIDYKDLRFKRKFGRRNRDGACEGSWRGKQARKEGRKEGRKKDAVRFGRSFQGLNLLETFLV
jgi:hypothetical protein